jgi:hypothetical protein
MLGKGVVGEKESPPINRHTSHRCCFLAGSPSGRAFVDKNYDGDVTMNVTS